MTKNYLLTLLTAVLLFASDAFAQQTIPLSISIGESKDVTLNEIEPGTVELTTHGAGAMVRLSRFDKAVPKQMSILSFDYFCASGMEFMVVLANDKHARIEESMVRLPVAEGWSTYSVDVSDRLAECGVADGFLTMLVVPNAANHTVMRVRNIRLRASTEKELVQIKEKQNREEREKRMETDITSYLTTDYTADVANVKVTESQIEISGDLKGLNDSKAVYLCEVPIFGDVTEKDFLTQIKINSTGKFTTKLKRTTEHKGMKYDRVYSRWVLAQKSEGGYTLCSNARYADEQNSKYDLPHEVVKGKKGIGGFAKNAYESDLEDLQITSVTVNIWLDGFLRLTPSEKTMPFEYNGRTYYADKKAIGHFDQTLQATAKRGIIVSAIILMSPQRSSIDQQVGRLMEHPDFNQAGIYTMPNMTNLESFNLYAAAIDFLAARYSRPDNKYGRIHHWIAHNEVDAGWVWTNAGVKTPLRFMDIYVKSMRMLYYTARKYNPHSEVLITLTHYWQLRHNEYCYPSAKLLDLLIDYTNAEGDFRWGVAQHPYPQSLFEPKSWLDDQADYTFNTPLITFKNIEVLNAWIKQPRALYKGTQKRTLYLSEQNPNSKDYSDQALKEQAAGMAYAWKKIDACDGIDAYQMHAWFDNRGEGGLRIGMRRFGDDQTDPGGRKPIWFVFKDLDTPDEDKSCEFAKDVIGIKSWDEVIYKDEIK